MSAPSPAVSLGVACVSLGIGIVISGLAILPIMNVISDGGLIAGGLICLALPGMIISMACANNVHAFSTSISFIANALVYSLVALLIVRRVIRRKLLKSEQVGEGL
jgi:hypothetical protein